MTRHRTTFWSCDINMPDDVSVSNVTGNSWPLTITCQIPRRRPSNRVRLISSNRRCHRATTGPRPSWANCCLSVTSWRRFPTDHRYQRHCRCHHNLWGKNHKRYYIKKSYLINYIILNWVMDDDPENVCPYRRSSLMDWHKLSRVGVWKEQEEELLSIIIW